MSILIRGMEMPESCEDCPLENYDENYYGDESNYRCPLIYKGYTSNNRYGKRRDDCPLVEVPPHGRLIDVNALHPYMLNEHYKYRLVYDADEVANAPIIIPAEEVER